MLDHADTYSQAFSAETYKQLIAGTYKGETWKLSSFWYKDFDSMSKKTVLRQLLSKWGIMSVEMQEAFIKDQTEMKENGDYEYIDNPKRDFAKPTKEEVVEQQQEETGTEEPPLEVESSDFDV